MLKAGIHPKVVSERLGHANIGITLDIYSHVLPGLQEAAAEKFDRIFEVDESENSDANVSKMLANGDGVECRPYRSRTCDTLIKSQSIDYWVGKVTNVFANELVNTWRYASLQTGRLLMSLLTNCLPLLYKDSQIAHSILYSKRQPSP